MTVFVTLPQAILLWGLFALGCVIIPLFIYGAVAAFIKAWRELQ